MHHDDLRNLLRQQPFLPFRLHVTDGTNYEIRHPESALVSRTLLQLSVPAPSTLPTVIERQVGIALIHILRYEQDVPLPPPTTN
jgi:hypothetical protein